MTRKFVNINKEEIQWHRVSLFLCLDNKIVGSGGETLPPAGRSERMPFLQPSGLASFLKAGGPAGSRIKRKEAGSFMQVNKTGEANRLLAEKSV